MDFTTKLIHEWLSSFLASIDQLKDTVAAFQRFVTEDHRRALRIAIDEVCANLTRNGLSLADVAKACGDPNSRYWDTTFLDHLNQLGSSPEDSNHLAFLDDTKQRVQEINRLIAEATSKSSIILREEVERLWSDDLRTKIRAANLNLELSMLALGTNAPAQKFNQTANLAPCVPIQRPAVHDPSNDAGSLNTPRSVPTHLSTSPDEVRSTANESAIPRTDPSTCPVRLQGEGEEVIVLGEVLPALTSARYAVIKALVEAFPKRLKGKNLVDASAKSDARKMLKAISGLHQQWAKVIDFPRKRYGNGYGLIHPKH